MLASFFVGLILALTVTYVVYIKVPALNPSLPLDSPNVREWVTEGRFHNFGGFAVFYHDSIGDIIRHTFTSADRVYPNVINKPVLLLIHGLPMWSFDYEKIYPKMQDLFHVVAIDFLGNGMSDKPQDIDYTFALQADVIESVLGEIMFERQHLADTFQLDRSTGNDGIHMVSHDIGASVAQELLARRLDNTSTSRLDIKSCVFLNGGLFAEKIVPHQPPALRKALRSKILGPILQLLTTYKGFSASLSSLYGPSTKPTEEELRITWDAMVHKDGQYLLHKTTNYALDRVKNTHRLVSAMLNSSRYVPMLHINGPADTIAGRHMAEEFDRRVPHATAPTVYLDADIGHFPHLEAPQEVLSSLRHFYTSDSQRFRPAIVSTPAELFD